MKGTIVYITKVEKEVEIPDELVNMTSNWFFLTNEEKDKAEQLSESVWGEIPWDHRIGMYCNHIVIEEY
jgi:hypothetical protein